MNTQSNSILMDHCDVVASNLKDRRVLVAGVGNIGTSLAPLLAPHVRSIRLVDRDVVESRNASNQLYAPHHAGQSKVDVTADFLEGMTPGLRVERKLADLEDLPWGEFAGVDIAFGCLDSLRARQVLAEKLGPLGIPYIDGGVGEPLLVRVQVLLPGGACLECGWSRAHYRQMTTEYPCHPAAGTRSAATMSPRCSGAAVAGLMVAQWIRLLGDDAPQQSYEINGDLQTGRFVAATRSRNRQCRSSHASNPRCVYLSARFEQARCVDLLAAATAEFGTDALQFEFRRGLLGSDLFGSDRYIGIDQLRHLARHRLAELGLTTKDRVVIHQANSAAVGHLCFDRVADGLESAPGRLPKGNAS